MNPIKLWYAWRRFRWAQAMLVYRIMIAFYITFGSLALLDHTARYLANIIEPPTVETTNVRKGY